MCLIDAMTTCSVSAERHSTTLYTSHDGLNYELEGAGSALIEVVWQRK